MAKTSDLDNSAKIHTPGFGNFGRTEHLQAATSARKSNARSAVMQTAINDDGTTLKEYLESLPDSYRWPIQQAVHKLMSARNYTPNKSATKEVKLLEELMAIPLANKVPTVIKSRDDLTGAVSAINLAVQKNTITQIGQSR